MQRNFGGAKSSKQYEVIDFAKEHSGSRVQRKEQRLSGELELLS